MIVPQRNRVLVEIYECPICGVVYHAQTRSGEPLTSCTVFHAPGSCCHYGELVVAEKLLEKIFELLKDLPEWGKMDREKKDKV